jgi:hypothetical protein
MKSFTFLSFAVLPATVFGHIGFFDKSVYGADAGYGHELATPLANMDFDRWWFHGNIDKKPSSVFELPAGGKATLELACNRKFTSMGELILAIMTLAQPTLHLCMLVLLSKISSSVDVVLPLHTRATLAMSIRTR